MKLARQPCGLSIKSAHLHPPEKCFSPGLTGPSQCTVQACWDGGEGGNPDRDSTMPGCQDRLPSLAEPTRSMRTAFCQGKRLWAVLKMSELVTKRSGTEGHPSRENGLHKGTESRKAGRVKKTSAIFVWWEGMGQVRWKRLAGDTIPLPGIYPEKTIIQKESCTTVFTAALFTIARTWKQPKCPPTDEWIKKMWHIYTMEYYSAIKRNEIVLFVVRWMDLESVIQSEVSQKEKNKYHS